MLVTTETHGDLTCDIDADDAPNLYHGTLKYKGYEQGRFSGNSLAAVQENFKAIAAYIDAGGIVRGGIILTQYFTNDCEGDVLTVDGEALGTWQADEEEWCTLTLTGKNEHELGAPSPWMLHDSIIEWHFG